MFPSVLQFLQFLLHLECLECPHNPALKASYKKYSKILAKVIKEAKKLYCYERMNKSENEIQTTWKIIKRNI